jgi:hypothetical protein
MAGMYLYHFTSGWHLSAIAQAGVINVTESNHSMLQSGAAPDVVWLLDTPEVGHDHGLGAGDFKRTMRITVDVEAVKWTDWEYAKSMDPDWRRALLSGVGGEEAAEHWWVSLEPIDRSNWVEVRDVLADQVLWRRED